MDIFSTVPHPYLGPTAKDVKKQMQHIDHSEKGEHTHIKQWGLSRDGELLENYPQKPNY